MTTEEKQKKLETLPWQALYDLALEKEIDTAEISGKDKIFIIDRLLALALLSNTEIESLVSNYIYGNRVTFTLWSFNKALIEDNFISLQQLENHIEPILGNVGFRNLHFLSVENRVDRLEILYVYSKEYSYTDEDGRSSTIWEQHRGCLWVGINVSYLACISKHDKMTSCLVNYVSERVKIGLTQIKPPKAAIERCINYKAISRIVLQGTGGEKTIVSRSEGLTDEQEREIGRIRKTRFDTSGSYIADIAEDTTATVKYNVKRGSIGIYRHLSAPTLFDWSQNAINIIFEEIDKLKGKPAEEIFKELGLETKWLGLSHDDKCHMNWFLSNIIAALDSADEYVVSIPEAERAILQKTNLFTRLPRIYCEKCDSYELPHCANCGAVLKSNKQGQLECDCGAPLKIVCPDNHQCKIEYWYLPTIKFTSMVEQNIHRVFTNSDIENHMCVINDQLHIVHTSLEASGTEIMFEDVSCFSTCINNPDEKTRCFAIRLNEKCDGTCSKKKADACVKDKTMVCLPKIFYTILPGFRPQPHKGLEYGDIAAEIAVGTHCYEMKGIIKKNSKNSGRTTRNDEELIEEYLLSTSTEGQEIIRQFVEQGMADKRCQVIAIVAPQYFDSSLKGTLRFLARLARKKVIFIELDQVCKIIEKNDIITVS